MDSRKIALGGFSEMGATFVTDGLEEIKSSEFSMSTVSTCTYSPGLLNKGVHSEKLAIRSFYRANVSVCLREDKKLRHC